VPAHEVSHTRHPLFACVQLAGLTGPVVATKRVGGAMCEEALLVERNALYTLVVEHAAEVMVIKRDAFQRVVAQFDQSLFFLAEEVATALSFRATQRVEADLAEIRHMLKRVWSLRHLQPSSLTTLCRRVQLETAPHNQVLTYAACPHLASPDSSRGRRRPGDGQWAGREVWRASDVDGHAQCR
jgi:hypothetical protein